MNKADYECAIDRAAQLLRAWLAVFPAPECHEQGEVVEATYRWLKTQGNDLSAEGSNQSDPINT